MDVPLRFLTAAMFESLESARAAVAALKASGIPQEAIYLSWQYANVEPQDALPGHSKRSVAAAVAGGGIAGVIAASGAVVLLSGLGPAAAAGALAASALNGLAGMSAAIGATGGAMARMLSDPDVEGRGRDSFQQTFRKRQVMVSVDVRQAKGKDQLIDQVLTRLGGQAQFRG